jgi:hypothetical protein
MRHKTDKPVRLELTVDLAESADELLPEHHVTAARILREAADRIEKGADLGGFHYSSTENYEGGFALYPVKK